MGDWNSICLNLIRKEKGEIAKHYNIRFGQTEVYCASCKRPCWPGRHTCQDIRLRELNEAKRKIKDGINLNLLNKIREIGRSKVAIMLEIDPKTVSNWIDRGNIPLKYQETVDAL